MKLGGKCECCGTKILSFLTLDHKNDDGHIDRRKPLLLYRQIIRDARRDVRILCFNCNCGRALNGGICPHKFKKLRQKKSL
jgi:hypothetical protein